jgi:NAD+ synthase
MSFNKNILALDPAEATAQLTAQIRQSVTQTLRRRGAVIGISGGVDSSVVLALCARALGPQRVLALMLPEQDSSPDSLDLAREVADHYDVAYLIEDITAALAGFGCYRRRDEAIQRLFPEYDPATYKNKITLPPLLDHHQKLNIHYLTIIAPNGEEQTVRLPAKEYMQIVAASNFKQRTRMAMLYYHAEARHYAVVGTANKNEHGQGFFVKHGDGGVDIRPIAHLFKTQIYQLAEYLDVPATIRQRKPTSDTYSADTSQEEFFFRLPFAMMDPIWYAQEQQVSPAAVAPVMGLSEEQVQWAFDDLAQKRQTTEYLRLAPLEFA